MVSVLICLANYCYVLIYIIFSGSPLKKKINKWLDEIWMG